MKVLITGGYGRVGRYVIDELNEKHELVVLDIKEEDHPGHYRFVKGDISNYEDTLNATKGIEAVIHLAGIPTDLTDVDRVHDLMKINVVGTFHALEAAAVNHVKKFIFASSICAGGYIYWKKPFDPDYFPVDEQHPCKPDDMYGTSKLMGEIMCYAYSRRYGMSMICLRLASILFPDVYERTQTAIRRHKDPASGKGRLWNYVDVRDVAVALGLVLEKEGISFETYNIGAADVLAKEDSLDLLTTYYPNVKTIQNKDSLLVEKQKAVFDISKAQKELGYAPKHNWREYLDLS